jgi:hypothetical protein
MFPLSDEFVDYYKIFPHQVDHPVVGLRKNNHQLLPAVHLYILFIDKKIIKQH